MQRVFKKHYYNQTPLYEANYAKLAKLIPDSSKGVYHVTHAGNESGTYLSMEVVENHKYTTIARLEIGFDSNNPLLTCPAFVLRICNDVKVAEVIAYHNQTRFKPDYDYPNQNMLHRDEKHQVNRLLGELLDYFLNGKCKVATETLDKLLSW